MRLIAPLQGGVVEAGYRQCDGCDRDSVTTHGVTNGGGLITEAGQLIVHLGHGSSPLQGPEATVMAAFALPDGSGGRSIVPFQQPVRISPAAQGPGHWCLEGMQGLKAFARHFAVAGGELWLQQPDADEDEREWAPVCEGARLCLCV
jgi:hypothetical protein